MNDKFGLFALFYPLSDEELAINILFYLFITLK